MRRSVVAMASWAMPRRLPVVLWAAMWLATSLLAVSPLAAAPDGTDPTGDASPEAARSQPTARTLRIQLPGALPYEKHRDDRRGWSHDEPLDLQLDLTRRDGAWDRAVWAWSPDLPGQEHLGRLTAIEQAGDQLKLTAELTLDPTREPVVTLGGSVVLEITLQRGDAGEGEPPWIGQFAARSRTPDTPATRRALEEAWGWGVVPGRRDWQQQTIANRLFAALTEAETTGKATAETRPALWPTALRDLPIAAGEHPRLLFTASDRDALRAYAKTVEGKRIIDALKAELAEPTRTTPNLHAVGHGLLYQLTGEQKHADRAAEQARGWFYSNYPYGWWDLHPNTILGTALAYDLCYDAWDPTFRATVHAFLARNIRDLAMRHDAADAAIDPDRFRFANPQDEFRSRGPADAKAARYRAAAAVAALAILNDPPPVFKPTPLEDVPTIEPPEDYQPWVGVPVVDFEDDVMPRRWLVNGPFLAGTTDAAVQRAHGGWENLRPESGQTITVDGVDLDWRRYIPAQANGPEPRIYPRDCNRYWTASTGAGYPPGRQLVRQWRERGDDGRIHVVLYTVLRNDRDRIVQARPNWGTHSHGARMWLNGHPLDDGDLVRLPPGRYPLVVDTPIMGTYANQSPRLAEYTPRDYQCDLTRWRRANDAAAGAGPLNNDQHRHAIALMRSVMRYVEHEVGPDGWGGWETHDTLLPLMNAVQQLTGHTPAARTGLAELTRVAARMRSHGDPAPFDRMVNHAFPFASEATRPVARWYIDTHTDPFRTPADAAIAFATHPRDVKPQAPEPHLPLAHRFQRHGVVTFNSGMDGRDDHLLTLHTAAGPRGSIHAAGHLRLHAFGRHWLHPGPTGSPLDFDQLNNIAVADHYPAQHPTITHERFQPDGSGSVTMRMAGLRPAETNDRGDFRFTGPPAEFTIQRSVAVDYSGQAGAPVVVILADRFEAAGRREMIWRARLGNLGRGEDDVKRFLTTHHNGFDLDPPDHRQPTEATMQLRMHADQPMLPDPARYHDGRDYLFQMKLNRKPTEAEKRQAEHLTRAADRIGEAAQRMGRGATHDAPDPDAPDPAMDEDAVLDSALGDLEADLQRQRAQRESQLPPTTWLTVITLQTTDPPRITFQGDGDDRTIQVGPARYHYDGKRLHLDRR